MSVSQFEKSLVYQLAKVSANWQPSEKVTRSFSSLAGVNKDQSRLYFDFFLTSVVVARLPRGANPIIPPCVATMVGLMAQQHGHGLFFRTYVHSRVPSRY